MGCHRQIFRIKKLKFGVVLESFKLNLLSLLGGNGGRPCNFNIFGHEWEKYTPTLDQLPFKGDTIIGNDVWIGMDTVIMPGIKIGDGAIVAAKSVITKDVEPYTIVGGNPEKKLKTRFSKEIINELLEIKWWDLDIDIISAHIDVIVNGDMESLRSLKNKR